ncbi:MAG: hypothetical protein GTO45_34845, partial [Candidatus Aminicenantes bacterium]|nr:hypothetical protein [Candidatus Aminicenantes bacterium]NIM83871.1 hypothetical protein [Candidatus Aminicenantes bacterium]NIN23335.1 hypothetical protein [Candidatus Aminicenantes bacterium]NIN89961.1 hypothetical protein [Candidatus Aminicenantes bacterium]NIO86571.1 hypothetical protein [Candidatus Aminicenantes bacterium]
MKYKLIAVMASLCIIIVICASPVFAKVYARVSGSVKTEDDKPIAGARVILIFAADGAKIELTTDKKGRWSKVNLRAGAWTMGFMADGYEPENINVTLYAIKTNPPIDIKLAPVPESPLKKPDELYQQGKYAEAVQEYQNVLSENQELY